ncbi:uncharacterized protein PHACADRAFT_256907 [Phanerochaete carnosa HHB-10118-sp]|uniref:Uncharacterized protein n=1 Tax=Phanerochaete carnosa (strain HHB-10118-sp) TaxID=650164 RepID=K5VWL7_PHACS|nr:uncharacterized protein PHACADRAFT_256907 [Phanerochaete carnosa HHB-10118-sp]EKM55943.1 hypothetical protein PHACADRAFT_256907 [Phanerochaete carnosa HHB-10118-sp]
MACWGPDTHESTQRRCSWFFLGWKQMCNHQRIIAESCDAWCAVLPPCLKCLHRLRIVSCAVPEPATAPSWRGHPACDQLSGSPRAAEQKLSSRQVWPNGSSVPAERSVSQAPQPAASERAYEGASQGACPRRRRWQAASGSVRCDQQRALEAPLVKGPARSAQADSRSP